MLPHLVSLPPLRPFAIVSAQTGDTICREILACSEEDACDRFAELKGFNDAEQMWDMGRFEYIRAEVLS